MTPHEQFPSTPVEFDVNVGTPAPEWERVVLRAVRALSTRSCCARKSF